SRAGDPHLHTHVLAANLTKGADGRWSALDGRLLYRLSKTVGCVYEAHLRHAMTRDLGVEWGRVSNGIADLVGIPKPVLRLFSKRRAQIEAALEEHGYTSARAAEAAALATRQPKGHANEGPDVRERWWEEAAAVGFGHEQLAAVTGRVVEAEPTVFEAIVDEL